MTFDVLPSMYSLQYFKGLLVVCAASPEERPSQAADWIYDVISDGELHDGVLKDTLRHSNALI